MNGRLTHAEEIGVRRHLVVAERLRGRRRDLGLTQKEVVARLRRIGVGTTNKALSSLEHGAGIDVCKLPEIAAALECTLTYLVGLTDDPTSWEPDPGGSRAPTTALPRPHRAGPRDGEAGHHDRAVDPAPRRPPPILAPLDLSGPVRRRS